MDATNSVTPALLRGLGRYAFRQGAMPSAALTFAAEATGKYLSAEDRNDVFAGWAAERGEVRS